MNAGTGAGPTLVRAPNHLGELVLALPALAALARRPGPPPLVQVVEGLAPLLEMAPSRAEVLPLRNRRAVVREARRLRRRSPGRGVLLTPSFSGALLFWLARIPVRRGTDTDARGWLLTDAVDRAPLLDGHRVDEYRVLALGPAVRGGGSGSESPPAPRLRAGDRARDAWASVARAVGLRPERGGTCMVGLVPGGRAPARRWPLPRWESLCRRLTETGRRVVVFGGPGEAARTARVAAPAGAWDLGGRTDLRALAGGLAACDLVVANDTGPMHLAAALDRPLVVPWGAGDPGQTRPLSRRARILARPDLPCHPCLERECPRRGTGFEGPEARRECLRLLAVDAVEAAARAALEERDPEHDRSAPGGGRGVRAGGRGREGEG